MNEHELLQGLEGLIEGEQHPLTALANAAALLWASLPDINWVGFYFLHDGVLCLGPFQGKPACTHIALSRGVCGAAFTRDAAQVVPDVHLFPGHVACDAASRSEVVVPLHAAGRPIGVLDVDSPVLGRFGEADGTLLTRVAALLERHCDLAHLSYNLQGPTEKGSEAG